jgi:hypothetical protein
LAPKQFCRPNRPHFPPPHAAQALQWAPTHGLHLSDVAPHRIPHPLTGSRARSLACSFCGLPGQTVCVQLWALRRIRPRRPTETDQSFAGVILPRRNLPSGPFGYYGMRIWNNSYLNCFSNLYKF